MALTNGQRGTAFERRVMSFLTEWGYWCVRSAGSHGEVDIVALKPDEVVLVQCKISGRCDPIEWNDLLALGWLLGAAPVVAYRPTPRTLGFFRLETIKVDRKGGARSDWRPSGPPQPRSKAGCTR